MKKLIIIILSFLSLGFCNAQKTYFAEVKTYLGYIAPHRLGMESLAQDNTYGFELNYIIENKFDEFYKKKYNFPFSGYGVSFGNLGNPNVLGNVLSAYTMIELKLFSLKSFSLNSRISPGLAYLTQKYDKILNPENIALGSHICFYFNLSFNFYYRFSEPGLDLRISPGLLHYSNGGVIKPNLGLNQPYLSVSLSKNIATNSNSNKSEYNRDHLRKHEAWIIGTLTSSDEYSRPPEGRGGGFLCSTIAFGYNYQYSEIGKIGISNDIFYDSNLHYYFDTNWDTLIIFNQDIKDVVRVGVSIGHQLIYNRLEMVTFAGVYYYNKVRPGDPFYTRIGVRYYLNDYFFVNLTLKAFGFKAQYIEPGIGFSFRRKKT
jgi:hypothetical protein